MTHVNSLIALALLAMIGCSDASTDGPQQSGPAAGASASGAAGTSAGSAGAAAAGAGATTAGGATSVAGAPTSGGNAAGGNAAGGSAAGGNAGSSAAAGGGAGAASSGLDAPDNASALQAFLDAKQYSGWAKEAAFHASSGPHGDAVRVYYSPKAVAALKGGADTLPAGAATVKELTSGGSLYGWAVWVKVQDATDNGKGFYWYEIIHQGGGNNSIYGNALGSDDCVGCHVAGKDYNLSTLPFQ